MKNLISLFICSHCESLTISHFTFSFQVFIRELIANASDALEKRRCLEMGDKGPTARDVPFEIHIECDAKNRKLVFTDTGDFIYIITELYYYLGIGMNEEELVGLLGTIAKSGSKAFRSDEEKAESLIGL